MTEKKQEVALDLNRLSADGEAEALTQALERGDSAPAAEAFVASGDAKCEAKPSF